MKITPRRMLIAIWVLGFLAPFLWLARLFFGAPATVEVNRETTYLIGTKLADGSLDFSAALWTHCNQPVAEEFNAAYALSRLPQIKSVRQLIQDIRDTEGNGYHESARQPGLISWGQTRPWSTREFPRLAQLVAAETDYADLWKIAVDKPRLAKPQGIPMETLTSTLQRGASALLRRAMLAAGENRWEDAVADLSAVDHSAELLAQLQCGWQVMIACRIRTSVSSELALAVLDADEVNPLLAAFIQNRVRWAINDVVAEAADNAIRIRFQLEVRDLRQQPHRLHQFIGSGLVGKNATARDLQLNQIRNTISWTAIARVQNEVVSQFVEALRQKTFTECKRTWNEVVQNLQQAHDVSGMIRDIRRLELSSVTDKLAYAVAIRSYRIRMAQLKNVRKDVEHHRQMALTALAMASYRQEHGKFPEQLSDLPPKWHAAVLTDVTTGSAPNYHRTNDEICVGSLTWKPSDRSARSDR